MLKSFGNDPTKKVLSLRQHFFTLNRVTGLFGFTRIDAQ